MKLIMVDLDGTLFDTTEVNYCAYQEAAALYNYKIDHDYYCNYCNGKHYLSFLSQITTHDEKILSEIHTAKKNIYSKYLNYARLNKSLLDIISLLKSDYKIALVTTASKENTYEILNEFDIIDLFDLIITSEDVIHKKPDPECFIKAMKQFNATSEECIIFEDSDVGIQAATQTGSAVYIVKGYN